MTKCVHCITRQADTDDHLIPRSWYPDTTPANLPKWKFPSCSPCNHEYSKLEDTLLFQFGVCLPPEDALAAGIPEKVLRSVDPNFSRNPPDRRMRVARRARAQRDITFSDKPPSVGVFPNFGIIPGVEYKEFGYVGIAVSDIAKMVRKFAKGLAYIENRAYLDDSLIIEYCPFDNHDDPWIEDIFASHGSNLSRGPGVVIRRAAARDDCRHAFMRIELWGRLKFYVRVSRREPGREPDGRWLVA